MKIRSIEAWHNREDGPEATETRIDVGLMLPASMSIQAAIAAVFHMIDAAQLVGATPATAPAAVKEVTDADMAAIKEAVAATAPATRRGRRTIPTQAPAEPVQQPAETPAEPAQQAVAAEAPAEPSRRSRRAAVQENAPAAPAGVADIELTKACSNAAAVIGPELVQEIIEEFKVKSIQELAQAERERFIGELAKEIELARLAGMVETA